MRNSKILNEKVLIPAAVLAAAVGLIIWGLSPAIATVNQTMNSATSGYAQLPKITGSVDIGQTAKNFMDNNIKVSFVQAATIAANQVTNGTIVGGHLGVVQGYLVYSFIAVNAQSKTGFLTIVDAGNGKILYTSHGQQTGSFGIPMFGASGPSRFGGFGGFWHGQFGPWRGAGFDGALSQHQYPLGMIN